MRKLTPYNITKGSLYHLVLDEEITRLKTPLELSGFVVDKITAFSKG